MYLTEKEIFSQYAALRQTYAYILTRAQELKDLYQSHRPRSLTFIGCGSGFCLCQSGATSAQMRLGVAANALAAGDLLINFRHYRGMLQEGMIIAPSRSGGTSEVVLAVEKAKELGIPVIAISAKAASPLSELADLTLEIPWAFDESVCQTRTVTNLYTADLMLIAILAQDDSLLAEIDAAITAGPAFMERYTPVAQEIAQGDFDHVVILADSELDGIASEAAIAFMEIPQVQANYFHVLDVRHGPMVLIGEKTLVIAALSPEEGDLQRDLIRDLKGKGAKVAVVSRKGTSWGADWEVELPEYEHFAVAGIPFIFLPQSIGFYKALHKGLNPDLPAGLSAMIDLSRES
ncbi:MAG TPA: SIS domain-containing protein [Limnochordia bacterium]|nr:SIS domain-containing protein [Limnochordia bacterium]